MARVSVGARGARGIAGVVSALLTAVLAACGSSSTGEQTYPVGGTVAGLTVSGLALQNGMDTVNLAAGTTTFQFPTRLTAGTAYDVTVAKQPTGLTCGVHNGSGTVGTGNAATSVSVFCASGQQFVYAGGDLFSADSVTGALTLQAVTANCCFLAIADPLGHFLFAVAFTGGGLNTYAIDPATGFLTPGVELAPPAPAGFNSLAIDPSGQYLYATVAQQPFVYAYAIGAGVSLTPLAGSPFAAGHFPVALAVEPAGARLYAANSSDGTISSYAIGADGRLTALPGSPFRVVAAVAAPAVALDALVAAPAGGFLYAHAGIGSGSGIYGMSISSQSGALTALKGNPFDSPQTGPSSLAISTSGEFIFLANQNSNQMSVSAINTQNGALSPVVGSPFPGGGITGQITAEPTGRFVYTAGNLSVSGFSLNNATGALTPIIPVSQYISGPGNYVLVVRPSP
jgi:6-phosphogluconolactonase (cycloisomerase 2 family)